VTPRYQCKPADPWISLMMFTIVSGLSMDHEVFLLSRMREEWARSGDNSQAVPSGLASTARVIAAAIMVCVFGSLVIADPVRILGVFGLGLAVAVLVDATVVRMVLVPALVQLLGPANWWLPRWVGRAVPNCAIEPNADHLAGGGLVHTRPLSAKGCRVIPGIPAAGTRAQLSRRR
jgi:putative drug exporter of the RND superfamily